MITLGDINKWRKYLHKKFLLDKFIDKDIVLTYSNEYTEATPEVIAIRKVENKLEELSLGPIKHEKGRLFTSYGDIKIRLLTFHERNTIYFRLYLDSMLFKCKYDTISKEFITSKGKIDFAKVLLNK